LIRKQSPQSSFFPSFYRFANDLIFSCTYLRIYSPALNFPAELYNLSKSMHGGAVLSSQHLVNSDTKLGLGLGVA
jgi:hypothetical protein